MERLAVRVIYMIRCFIPIDKCMNVTHVFWKQLRRQKWEKKAFFSTSKKLCFSGLFWAPFLSSLTCYLPCQPSSKAPSFLPTPAPAVGKPITLLLALKCIVQTAGSVCRAKSASSTTLIDYLVSFKVNFGTHWCRFWLLSRIHPSCTQITTVWKHTELQSPSPEGWDLLVSNRRGSFSNCVGFFALRAGAHRATCRAEKLVIHRLREVEEAVKMS